MATEGPNIRWAVVGLGHITQVAVLPAFAHAGNSDLVALVSGDEAKRKELGERYRAPHVVGYDGYEELLTSGEVDAVYVATPNHLHRDNTIAAAEAGVHVLCEKPMAPTEADARAMIDAADRNGVALMIAYRLHFEAMNMEIVDHVRSGRIGEVRFFDSVFSQDVKAPDIRLSPFEKGGGSLFDMGVYCINAARYLMRDEPLAVDAIQMSRPGDERFTDCDEMTSAVLHFPGERLASFTSSLGAAPISTYRIVGTKGEIRAEQAYQYATPMAYELTVGGQTERHTFDKRDQFGPELAYFAECIRTGQRPEPDGEEGLLDVRLVQAIHEASETGQRVDLPEVERTRRPDFRQVRSEPGVEKPPEVHASSPSE